MSSLSPAPDLLNKKLQLSKIPRGLLYTLEFEKQFLASGSFSLAQTVRLSHPLFGVKAITMESKNKVGRGNTNSWILSYKNHWFKFEAEIFAHIFMKHVFPLLPDKLKDSTPRGEKGKKDHGDKRYQETPCLWEWCYLFQCQGTTWQPSCPSYGHLLGNTHGMLPGGSYAEGCSRSCARRICLSPHLTTQDPCEPQLPGMEQNS